MSKPSPEEVKGAKDLAIFGLEGWAAVVSLLLYGLFIREEATLSGSLLGDVAIYVAATGLAAVFIDQYERLGREN